MSVATTVELAIEPMQDSDVDAVTAIEQQAHAFPWTRGNFTDSLRAGHSAWVVRDGRDQGRVIGYGVLMMSLDEAELLDITVAPASQRSGLGGRLLARLFGVARNHGARCMLLEVRPSNEPALALYRKAGFAEIGRRRAYYHGKEDAIVMACDL